MSETPSSVSDHNAYRSVCEKAVADDKFFETFKADPAYREILEHTSPDLGISYFMMALYQTPELVVLLENFKRNDIFGGPVVHDYGNPIGKISPATLRYVKVLSDLTFTFGSLDGKSIVEIGGGYGGQCLITALAYKVKSYTIIDLPCALKLQEKFLKKQGIGGVQFLSIEDLPAALPSDLLVSNYAITECTRSVTDIYFERVVRHAARGYITGNKLSHDSYSRQDFEQKIPKGMCVGEYPATAERNYIFLWK